MPLPVLFTDEDLKLIEQSCRHLAEKTEVPASLTARPASTGPEIGSRPHAEIAMTSNERGQPTVANARRRHQPRPALAADYRLHDRQGGVRDD
jgi:hypothetical protein